MAELPQFQDTQPKLNPSNVSSNAQSYDAFAKVLGSIAQSATQEVAEIAEEQSNALAMQAQNSIADTVTGAQINLIENPDHAMEIATQSRDALNNIVNNAFVNKKHRGQLKQLGNSSLNQIDLMAARTNHQQIIKNTQIALHREIPNALKDINRLYMSGDFSGAEIRQNNLQSTLDSALKIGAVTPNQYENFREMILGTIEIASQNLQMLKSGDATAYDYHKNNNTPYGKINTDSESMPTNEYTNENLAHYNQEATYQRISSDITRYGRVTDVQAFNARLTPDQHRKLFLQWQGANEAKALIDSGSDFIEIGNEFKNLQSLNKTGLSMKEEGKYNYLRNYFDRLENGEFVNLMAESPQGSRIRQDKIMSDRAIERSSVYTNEEKIFKLKENEDWERQQYINLGFARHIDPKFIKPLTEQDMLPYKSSFMMGGDPELAITNLRATTPQLKAYIADGMEKQNQSAVMYMIGNAGDAMTQGMAQDLIRANQDGFDKTLIKVDEDSQTYSKIRGAVANDPNVQTAMQYIAQLPYDVKGGQSLSDGMIDALSNAVILQAKRAGDFGVKNLSVYTSSLSDQVRKSYNIYQDQNMRINNTVLKLSPADLKSIGMYAKDVAYSRIRKTMTEVEYLDFYDRNPLMLINTPNNNFVMINSTTGDIALDKEGQPLFEWPYTDVMIKAAREHTIKNVMPDELVQRHIWKAKMYSPA